MPIPTHGHEHNTAGPASSALLRTRFRTEANQPNRIEANAASFQQSRRCRGPFVKVAGSLWLVSCCHSAKWSLVRCPSLSRSLVVVCWSFAGSSWWLDGGLSFVVRRCGGRWLLRRCAAAPPPLLLMTVCGCAPSFASSQNVHNVAVTHSLTVTHTHTHNTQTIQTQNRKIEKSKSLKSLKSENVKTSKRQNVKT